MKRCTEEKHRLRQVTELVPYRIVEAMPDFPGDPHIVWHEREGPPEGVSRGQTICSNRSGFEWKKIWKCQHCGWSVT